MTSFSEDGSGRHGETASGDDMDDEVGDSVMTGCTTGSRLTGGPSMSGSTNSRSLLDTFTVEGESSLVRVCLVQHRFTRRLAVARPSMSYVCTVYYLLVAPTSRAPLLTYRTSHVRTFLHLHHSKQASVCTMTYLFNCRWRPLSGRIRIHATPEMASDLYKH